MRLRTGRFQSDSLGNQLAHSFWFGLVAVVLSNPDVSQFGHPLVLQVAVFQSEAHAAVLTHAPVPFAAATGSIDLAGGDPQSDQIAPPRPRSSPLFPVIIEPMDLLQFLVESSMQKTGSAETGMCLKHKCPVTSVIIPPRESFHGNMCDAAQRVNAWIRARYPYPGDLNCDSVPWETKAVFCHRCRRAGRLIKILTLTYVVIGSALE